MENLHFDEVEHGNGEEITLDTLARMVARGFQHVDKQVREVKEEVGTFKKDVKDSFERVYADIDGVRDDVKQARGANRIMYGELLERIEKVEKEVAVLKGQRGK